jgi:biopolymer transport protein ExbB
MELGGPLMWPLLGFSILLGAVLFERLWVIGLCHLMLGLRVDRRRLWWHHRALPFFSDLPPSLGLLGTVMGVIKSFNLMGGQIDGHEVGIGLSIACMTTAFGLAIAIVAAFSRYVLDALIGDPADMERRRC